MVGEFGLACGINFRVIVALRFLTILTGRNLKANNRATILMRAIYPSSDFPVGFCRERHKGQLAPPNKRRAPPRRAPSLYYGDL
jgi:hypothetical protein